jgi:hypothetical protein
VRPRSLIARVAILALVAAAFSPYAIAQMTAGTASAFEAYVRHAESQIRQDESSAETFLAAPSAHVPVNGETEARLRRGEVLVEKCGASPKQVPGGLIHHWVGFAFIPNSGIEPVLTVLQDYDHLTRYYHPDVADSRLISRSGDDFHISIRLRRHELIAVVLDTQYDVQYGRLDATHQYSFSRSTSVREIADPGTSSERALAGGQDHGFLWRLNTYWRFVQADDGVFVECEAISLTRDVPKGLGWLIGPFIQNIPRDSLRFTLNATRDAVAADQRAEQAQTKQPRVR